MNFAYYASKAIPDQPWHIIGALLLAVWSLLFPAPAIVYQSFAVLIVLDTITGVAAAVKRKAFNSRSWRTKLLPKVFSYSIIPGALWTFGNFLLGTPLEGAAGLLAHFTLASIALIELTSILENSGALLGKRITLKWDARELRDLMEANHANGRHDSTLREGQHRPDSGPRGPD